jgi:hypothetical protein
MAALVFIVAMENHPAAAFVILVASPNLSTV